MGRITGGTRRPSGHGLRLEPERVQPAADLVGGGVDHIPTSVWLLAIEASSDGILVVDGEGAIAYANRAAADLLGRPQEQLLGEPFGMLGDDPATEVEIPTPQGPRACEIVTHRAALSGQELLVLSLRDVTQRRRIAEEQRRTVQQAEAMAEAKNALLRMVAHELRSPLAVINGYVSLMSGGHLGPIPELWAEPLKQTVENTAQLRAMVEQILTAASLEAGRLPLARQIVDLNEVARRAVNRASGRAALAGAALRLQGGVERLLVDVDPAQIGTILDNLLNNAIKYSDGDAEVEVEVGRKSAFAELRVKDNGLGIAEDQQQLVFERFRRLDTAVDGGRSGTGLGLAIARDLAELNDGVLKIESSQPGRGSCFLLRLPLADAATNSGIES